MPFECTAMTPLQFRSATAMVAAIGVPCCSQGAMAGGAPGFGDHAAPACVESIAGRQRPVEDLDARLDVVGRTPRSANDWSCARLDWSANQSLAFLATDRSRTGRRWLPGTRTACQASPRNR